MSSTEFRNKVAGLAAKAIMDNLSDRKGIGNEIDQLDENVRSEIVEAIENCVRVTLLNCEVEESGD